MFIVYWLENVAVWAITIVKVRTALGVGRPGATTMTINGRPVDPADPDRWRSSSRSTTGSPPFVHGVFAFVMAFLAGGGLHPWTWLLTGLALALSHLGSLWISPAGVGG